MVIDDHVRPPDLADALCRRDFLSFVHRSMSTVVPGVAFVEGWHHGAVAWRLAQVEASETRRLIVNVPPRSLKSIIVSVAWPAWLLGRHPEMTIICVSYSADLATKFARDCRAVMNSPWYRRCFPSAVISRERNAEHDFMTEARGGRFSTSTGGTLTGRGADLIIIDDPLKPEDAASEAARNQVIDWYSNTLVSRLNDKKRGAIVLVMQRLHEADLAGHLLEAGSWDQLCLPAIAEVDEAIPLGPDRSYRRRAGGLLQPDREPLAVLNAIKADMGSALFSAQYQQAPVPVGGVIVQREWLKRYDAPPERRPGDRIVQSWDCASKEGLLNDFSVGITALVRRNRVYILDVLRERMEFPKLLKRCKALAIQKRATVLLIEDAAAGTQLIQQLRHNQSPGVPSPIRQRPDRDKAARLQGCSAQIEAGDLVLPKDAPWLADLEKELLGFPGARFDDQVDALSQLLSWVSRRQLEFELTYNFDDSTVGIPEVFTQRDGFRYGYD